MKIQKIAELAGVSTATVSRVFSHHPNVRPEVRERVLAVARKQKWRPRCFSAGQKNVVVITPGRRKYPIASYVEMVLSELSSELADRGFRVEILPAENLDRLPVLPFRGVVAIGLDEKVFAGWNDRCDAPLVLIDSRSSGKAENIFSVSSDEEGAMECAVSYLKQHGSTRIGVVIHGSRTHGNVELRIQSVRQALRKHGLPDNPGLILTAEADTCLEAVGRLLRQNVDALFCPGGNMGIVAAYALTLFNRKVPDDISLIASERTIYSRYVNPPQTSISQDYPALAKAAADILENPESARKDVRIPYFLIERESVRQNG